MKTMIIYVATKLVVECEDNTVTPQDVISDVDYTFESQSIGANIVDTEIVDFDVIKD